jgi:D-alanyl-D-alanine carboxypeptidase
MGLGWRWLRYVFPLVLVSAALAAGGITAGAAGPRIGSTKGLSSALTKLVDLPGGPPGAVAVVQVGGATKVIAIGVGNLTTKSAPGVDEVARIASVSKAYSGAIALALVSKGRLSLTSTVGKILPMLPSAWAKVTLAQLLQHTSGVPDYIKAPAFLKELQTDPHAILTPNQLLDFVAAQPLLFKPGSKYAYSDSDNIIIGLMVEAATGASYDTELAKIVTMPLSLSQTTLPASATIAEPYIHGYDTTEKPAEDVTGILNPGLAWASGGMLSTPGELNTFMRAYVRGKFVSPSVRKSQMKFVPGGSGPPGPGTNSAGLGIYRYATSCGTVYGHTGNYPGYTIFAAASANGSRSVDVIVNTQLNDRPPVSKSYTALRSAELAGVCVALHS